MSYIFVDAVGDEQGPLSTAEMADRLGDGSITETTLCRTADGPMRFKPLTHFKPLRDAAAAAIKATPGQQQQQQNDAHDNAAADMATDEKSWWYEDDGGRERGPLSKE